MRDKDLRGIERAAILASALGENGASEVFKYMTPRDVHSIAHAMTLMDKISRTQLNLVLREFCQCIENETGLAIDTERFLKTSLSQAFGDAQAGKIMERIFIADNSHGFEALKWMEPRAISEIISTEHPQVIAIILSYLDPNQSADIVEYLPENIRSDVIIRVATLDGIQPSAINELNIILEEQIKGVNRENIKSTSIDGIRKAANILKHVDINIEGDIIDSIGEIDPELSQKVTDAMFVFEDLAEVDDRDIQTLLREITSESLVVALKGSDDFLKDKIFRNMSKRAAGMLREDIDERGPVKLREAERAKKEILYVARRLAEAGDISLGKPATTIYV